ncbi:hypothetical protein [Merismopedia glauca]|uniref:SPOR domain-containing protein n=1 Tax=Merismopedia glauca CCAP 1448/3 TaxID=1296344 RepID=A0A2T1BWN6_9CYAN|nr:hypothetical protein [Merismopedia glauca]PSB00425.1 hypothetical protein C7B64_23595 [Merismopedia glauca CCAP 1448/3]
MSKDSQISLPNQALQAALNSLDVDLEQEIFRYRRRQGIKRVSDRGLLTLGSSPRSDLMTTTTPNSPNPETSPPLVVAGQLKPGINPQNRDFRASTGLLARTETSAAPSGDYLASSEQLLRSLAEEEPKGLKQGKTPGWLNPLGFAALLLLLVAGGALAYVLYPNLWTDLVQGKKETQTASTSSTGVAPKNIKESSPATSTAVSAPNLAANADFVDLNLQNLSTVATTPSIEAKTNPPLRLRSGEPTISSPVVKNPVVNSVPGTENPQNLLSALLPPTQTPQNTQQPVVTQPQLSASGLPKLGRPAPNGKVHYYVLTNYTNNNSLLQGKRIARDAFVVPSPTGKKVQIATFFRKVDADTLVRKLQKRGISAQVYLD